MLLVVPTGERYACAVETSVSLPLLIIEIGPVLLWEFVKNALVYVVVELFIPALVSL